MANRYIPVERRLQNIEIDAETGCHVYLGDHHNTGYGRISVGGRQQMAHRVNYERERGPIPDGLVLDHLCRNRACINPDHLEAVTEQVNILRGVGPSAQHAAQTHCVNGHPFSIENTHLYRGQRACRACWPIRKARRRARLGAALTPLGDAGRRLREWAEIRKGEL